MVFFKDLFKRTKIKNRTKCEKNTKEEEEFGLKNSQHIKFLVKRFMKLKKMLEKI